MLTLRRLIDDLVLLRVPRVPSARNLKNVDTRFYVHAYFSSLATVSQHARTLGISKSTIRSSTTRLIEHGWAYKAKPTNGRRGALIVPWMPLDLELQIVGALAQVRTEVHFYGEWLMKNVLDLCVNDRDVHDNARPQWLTTPAGKRLELDRWYRRAGVAFEFQGEQHSEVDGRFVKTQEQLARRQLYDQIKRDLCGKHKIQLIELTTPELNFDHIRETVRGKFELFPLRNESPLFRELSGMCISYILR